MAERSVRILDLPQSPQSRVTSFIRAVLEPEKTRVAYDYVGSSEYPFVSIIYEPESLNKWDDTLALAKVARVHEFNQADWIPTDRYRIDLKGTDPDLFIQIVRLYLESLPSSSTADIRNKSARGVAGWAGRGTGTCWRG